MNGVNQNLAGPTAGQSLADYCKQMQGLGKTSADANGTAAATCYNNQSSCSSTCADLASKYEALANNCDSCASLSIYEGTAQTLQSMKKSCDQLASRVQILNNQALAANSSGGSGDLCTQVTQAQTQSLGGPTNEGASAPQNTMGLDAGGGSYDCEQNHGSAACVGCRINPNSAYCKAILEGQSMAVGKAGFQAPEKSAAAKPDDSNPFPTSYTDSYAQNLKAKAHPQPPSHTIPGGTTQGVPNSGGSGFETLTDSGNKKTVAQSAGTADILEDSLRSGEGYSQSANNPQNALGRNPSGANTANFVSSRFDLKKRLARWMSSIFPSAKGASAFKNLGNVRSCPDGSASCPDTLTYPETMGFLDSEWLPVGDTRSHGKFKILFSALALLGTLGAVSWLKWNLVKATVLSLAGRLPLEAAGTKAVPPPNRRKQEIPVSNNRRRVS
jgi:hypothetical protein